MPVRRSLPVDVCGFFSTTGQQKAYGCYPEGRDRDQIGHAFHFIEALGPSSDDGRGPCRGSGRRRHAGRAVANERRVPVPTRFRRSRRPPDGCRLPGRFASGQAWRKRGGWEPEIRLLDRIGTAFGTFSPRRLAEISSREKELQALTEQMSTYADRWKVAQAELQESLLQRFLDVHARLASPPRGTGPGRPEPGRSRGAAGGAPATPPRARARQPEPWQKLDRFREYAVRGSEAAWRLEVRRRRFSGCEPSWSASPAACSSPRTGSASPRTRWRGMPPNGRLWHGSNAARHSRRESLRTRPSWPGHRRPRPFRRSARNSRFWRRSRPRGWGYASDRRPPRFGPSGVCRAAQTCWTRSIRTPRPKRRDSKPVTSSSGRRGSLSTRRASFVSGR